MSTDTFGHSGEWKKPRPLRYSATVTWSDDGRIVRQPVNNGEIVGGRFDGLRIPSAPGIEWSADGSTFTAGGPTP